MVPWPIIPIHNDPIREKRKHAVTKTRVSIPVFEQYLIGFKVR